MRTNIVIDDALMAAAMEAGGLDAALEDSSNELVMLDLVPMEVLRGFRHGRQYDAARQLFAPLPLAAAGGETVALRAAVIYRELRNAGTTVRSPIDLMVGAWCIENDCPLLHDDRDCHGLKGLQPWTG